MSDIQNLIEKEVSTQVSTYLNSNTSWDKTFDKEELIRAAEEIYRERKRYELKVRTFCAKLRPCPLILQMYGSMVGVFGVENIYMQNKYEPYIPLSYKKGEKKDENQDRFCEQLKQLQLHYWSGPVGGPEKV